MAFVMENAEQLGQTPFDTQEIIRRGRWLLVGNVGWRIPGERGPLEEDLRGPQQLWR